MANDLKRILGRRIRAHRTARGLNQEKLAELIGRSTETISNIERARTLPSLPTLERLAQSLDVSLAELFDQAEGSRSRQRLDLEAKAQAFLTTLSDRDIEIAVKQLEALAEHKGSTR